MAETTHFEPDDGARQLRDGIRALVRRFSISERADVSCCGMTVAQAATLEVLAHEGEIRLGALGRRLGIAPSTLTRNLGRLEERGLIARTVDPEDGRAMQARLTPAGRRAAQEIERQEIRFAREILDRLPSQRRRSAGSLLADLLRAVGHATESCCPGAFEHLMKGVQK